MYRVESFFDFLDYTNRFISHLYFTFYFTFTMPYIHVAAETRGAMSCHVTRGIH